VEQKNWSVVRRLVGYDRYRSKEALAQLNRLYQSVRLYTNFFQPVMQLQRKSRHGARVHKVYDRARTPYQRVLDQGVLSLEQQEALAKQCHRLNPVKLLDQINQDLARLWDLADTKPISGSSVTVLSETTRTTQDLL
jgi:hypothetical protein